MIIHNNFEQRSDEWFDIRKGRMTGTKLKNVVVKRGTGKKIGFYELIAERIAVEPDDENPMARGVRLEEEAVAAFMEKTGLKVEEVGFLTREDNENIAVSPDGVIYDGEKITQSIEIKCLKSSLHLQAYYEGVIPSDYEMQVIQNFIVNDDLETLYFIFYDPRVPSLPLHYIEIPRSGMEEEIEKYREYQENILKEVDEKCLELAF